MALAYRGSGRRHLHGLAEYLTNPMGSLGTAFLDCGPPDNQNKLGRLREVSVEAYYGTTPSIRRSLEVEVTNNNPISQEDLVRLAIKLRNDLFDYEDKLGSCRDFIELKNSAGALVVAILEPVESRLSASPPKKTAQVYQFPPNKGSIPHSLH
jgi:hypothetical protein